MKLNRLLLAAALAATALRAAPLTETAAVQTRPETGAPVLAVLRAGTEPAPAADVTAPPGWLAVELAGPHEAYVLNKDFLKSLDVRPGAPLYTEPKTDATVLTTAQKDDAIEITGLLGRWTQIRLSRKITGFIRLPAASAVPVTTPAAAATAAPAAAPMPQAPLAVGNAVTSGTDDANSLPRLFQGQFVSTRHPFTPRRPYDYQLNDDTGTRIAYLDVSHLLQTEQIDKYVGHTVVVYGPAKPINNGQDILIKIESLQLK